MQYFLKIHFWTRKVPTIPSESWEWFDRSTCWSSLPSIHHGSQPPPPGQELLAIAVQFSSSLNCVHSFFVKHVNLLIFLSSTVFTFTELFCTLVSIHISFNQKLCMAYLLHYWTEWWGRTQVNLHHIFLALTCWGSKIRLCRVPSGCKLSIPCVVGHSEESGEGRYWWHVKWQAPQLEFKCG